MAKSNQQTGTQEGVGWVSFIGAHSWGLVAALVYCGSSSREREGGRGQKREEEEDRFVTHQKHKRGLTYKKHGRGIGNVAEMEQRLPA